MSERAAGPRRVHECRTVVTVVTVVRSEGGNERSEIEAVLHSEASAEDLVDRLATSRLAFEKERDRYERWRGKSENSHWPEKEFSMTFGPVRVLDVVSERDFQTADVEGSRVWAAHLEAIRIQAEEEAVRRRESEERWRVQSEQRERETYERLKAKFGF